MVSLKDLERKILPPEEVSGIFVSDSGIRLLLIAKDNLKIVLMAEEKLAPGVIVRGELKKSQEFLVALNNLKRKAGKYFERHPLAILSLMPPLFYLHVLELPQIPESTFEETAKLNASQMSPIKPDEGYFDWQNLGINLRTSQYEIFVAVGSRALIDPYLKIFGEAGIKLVAVEPASLSLVRAANYFSLTAEKNAPHIIFAVLPEGLHFVITREGKILVDRFLFWSEVEEARDGEISEQDFEAILIREGSKILNFYVTHYQEEVINAIVIAPALTEETAMILKKNFKLRVVPMSFPASIFAGGNLEPVWVNAIGAALRGSLIPRKEDTIVSLMPVGTEAMFTRHRLVSFISLWLGIAGVTVGGVLFMIGMLAGVLYRLQSTEAQSLRALSQSSNVRDASRLENEAVAFNKSVQGILEAKKMTPRWSLKLQPFFTALAREKGSGLNVLAMNFSAGSTAVNVQMSASSRNVINIFEKDLTGSGAYQNVDVPINSIADVPGGVKFNLTFSFK